MAMRLEIMLGLIALATPAALIGYAMSAPPASVEDPAAIEWRAVPPLGAAMARPLLSPADIGAGEVTGAPELVGVAGRLNVDAIAMVRGADGRVRALKPGEGIDGWQLRSLSIDAAYFTRGTQEARVPLDTEAATADQ